MAKRSPQTTNSSVILTRKSYTNEQRMQGARRQTGRKNEENIRLLGILASHYPGSHLAESRRYKEHGADDGWRYVLCIHTDQGMLTWHLPDEESDRLAFLPVLPNDSKPITRDAKLDLLDTVLTARAQSLR